LSYNVFRVSRDPRAPVSMDSDIRTYSRDPRANSSNAAATATQMPSQAVQQPARPQVAQQPAKPGSSTDNEKVILISNCHKKNYITQNKIF